MSYKSDVNSDRLEFEWSLLPEIKNNSIHRIELFTWETGLEPAISGVTGQRDNQLRYSHKRCLFCRKAIIVSIDLKK